MIEQYEKYLNCKTSLREKIGMLKEIFIEYYGEDKREEIEEKFSKALLIAYRSPDSTKRILKEIADIYTNELFKEVLKETSNWTQKDLCGNSNLEYSDCFPINKFKKFYNQYKLGEEGRIQKYKEEGLNWIQKNIPGFNKEDYDEIIRTQVIPKKYENILPIIKNNILYYADLSNEKNVYERLFKDTKVLFEKINPNATLENVSHIMEHEEIKELIKYAEILPEIISEYKSRMIKYEAFKEEIKMQEQIETEMKNEYYIKFIEENIDLLKDEDIQEFKILKNDSRGLTDYTKSIMGYGLNSSSILEVFSKESEQILSSNDESSWKKDSIKNDRIKYFKKNGIDLGDEYEVYLQSIEVKKIWPSFERVEKFLESKKRLLNEFNNAYYTSLSSHKEIREEIDSHQLLDKEDCFDAKLYTDVLGSTFVAPNVVKTPTGYDLFSLVVISCNCNDGLVDHNIIHELNHLFESFLYRVENNTFKVISGWDISTGKLTQQNVASIDTLNENREKREYELLNEIINEIITQEICEKMIEKDQHIFDTKETAIIKGRTSYEHTFFLVSDFYQEFKKEIIESRHNGNIEIIWNKVGKENFDEINNLFKIYYEHFQGMKVYSLYSDLRDKRDTEQTKIYYDLVTKRDKILEKMRIYSEEQELASQSLSSNKRL